MTLEQIKIAVDSGMNVFWSHTGYRVKKDGENYLIEHEKGSCIGLTWKDGETMNGGEEEFFIL